MTQHVSQKGAGNIAVVIKGTNNTITVKSGQARFTAFAKDFRSLWGVALGGPVILPVLATFANIAPPWPNQPSVVAAVFVVLTLLITYYRFTGVERHGVRPRTFILAAGSAVITVIAYLALLNTFVFTVPTTGEKIVLGCGFTHNAQLVAERFGFAFGGNCPGDDYVNLLASAQYNSYEIWGKWSLTAVTISLFALWVLIFASITACVGTFVISRTSAGESRRLAAAPAGSASPAAQTAAPARDNGEPRSVAIAPARPSSRSRKSTTVDDPPQHAPSA
jgi:hypothetical protein